MMDDKSNVSRVAEGNQRLVHLSGTCYCGHNVLGWMSGLMDI